MYMLYARVPCTCIYIYTILYVCTFFHYYQRPFEHRENEFRDQGERGNYMFFRSSRALLLQRAAHR